MKAKRNVSAINLADYKYNTPIQIRFVDIDKMGHVNNATILSYLEIARTNFFDEVIGQQDNWFERGLIIAHTDIDYLAPVYLRDEVKVFVRIAKTGTKSFDVEHALVKTQNNQPVICAVANTIIVCMDYIKKETIEIPLEWKEKMKDYN